MNDAFLENLAMQWRSEGAVDTARCAAEITRRRRRLVRDAALAAFGAALDIALAVAFGIWAIKAQDLLLAVSAVAFAAAAPVLLSARARMVGLLKFTHDVSPEAHLAALKAHFDEDRRRLVEVHACALILAVAAAAALGLVAAGLETAIALVPAAAWAVTAAAVEAWRFRVARRLQRNQAALEQLHRQAEDATDRVPGNR